jgi:hypothetical protein
MVCRRWIIWLWLPEAAAEVMEAVAVLADLELELVLQ